MHSFHENWRDQKIPSPPVNELNEKIVTATMPRMKPRACRSIVDTAELQVTHT